MVEKNAMLKPTSYETKYFVFLKRVPSKNRTRLWNQAPRIWLDWWERLRKKEGAASNRASLALIKPFFIHPFFSSTHLFHPSNFFIHPTCALCILPPPKETTERVKRRERRPRREASLAVIKPYLVHIPCIPCMFIYTSCPLCRSPPPNLATEWEQREGRRLPKTLPCSQQTLHIPCFFIRPKPPTLQYIHQHHQTWLQGEKRAEKKVLRSAKSDLASSPPE